MWTDPKPCRRLLEVSFAIDIVTCYGKMCGRTFTKRLDERSSWSNAIVRDVAMIGQCIETWAWTTFVTSFKIGSFPSVFAGGGDSLSYRVEADLSLGVLVGIGMCERASFGLGASFEKLLN